MFASSLLEVVNKKADGGISALHMAALNGHIECVQLLLDLGASVSEGTVEDGTSMDFIGDPLISILVFIMIFFFNTMMMPRMRFGIQFCASEFSCFVLGSAFLRAINIFVL